MERVNVEHWSQYDELVWHPYTSLNSTIPHLPVIKAKDTLLYLENGSTIIDAISSWWVNLHGHANEEIARSIYEQALNLEHVIFAGFTHEPACELANQLIQFSSYPFSKVFYSDNGSTAVEVAIKLAVQYWENKGEQRHRIIALDGAFHGDTFGAMSVSERGLFNKAFHSMLLDVDFVALPTKENQEKVMDEFTRLVQENSTACFIYEPLLQGAAGMRVYEAEILDQLIAIAQKHGVLCIADEVFTGFYRTGKPFASHYMKEQPDVMCLSKGITGGFMPFGATLISEKIVKVYQNSDSDKTFYHGHSYTANPLTCRAALTSLRLLQLNETVAKILKINDRHVSFVNRLQEHKDKLLRVNVLGTMLALTINTNASYASEARNRIYQYFIERGVLIRPLGNVIYVLPPYCITEQELNKVYQVIEEFLISFS